MEDIKARYYAIARQLLVGREGTEDSVANNVLVKHPFNLTHERYQIRCCWRLLALERTVTLCDCSPVAPHALQGAQEGFGNDGEPHPTARGRGERCSGAGCTDTGCQKS